MQRHFEQELESLKTTLIKMGSIAEEALQASLRALAEGDKRLAEHIIATDDRINTLEIEIDNAIVDLLALQQPVAIDLRLILAAQKINNDLERIGDHAVNIAESALQMRDLRCGTPLPDISAMGSIAQTMLREALDGFIHNDPKLGNTVLMADDQIDAMNRKVIQEIVGRMKSDQKTIDCGLEMIRVSRNLERVADLATNIAEEVIFIAQARVVKHHAEDQNAGET
ncbi:MAG TPA: phosphate signaling complex protein PhoU [Bacteroidota bacterium]|nr:phosphate signaling complex protein PhoU [Bacteroidota bacterium]